LGVAGLVIARDLGDGKSQIGPGDLNLRKNNSAMTSE